MIVITKTQPLVLLMPWEPFSIHLYSRLPQSSRLQAFVIDFLPEELLCGYANLSCSRNTGHDRDIFWKSPSLGSYLRTKWTICCYFYRTGTKPTARKHSPTSAGFWFLSRWKHRNTSVASASKQRNVSIYTKRQPQHHKHWKALTTVAITKAHTTRINQSSSIYIVQRGKSISIYCIEKTVYSSSRNQQLRDRVKRRTFTPTQQFSIRTKRHSQTLYA